MAQLELELEMEMEMEMERRLPKHSSEGEISRVSARRILEVELVKGLPDNAQGAR
jgi:hypothetical protein